MTNMSLDDVLEELGRWGIVEVANKWGAWHCEVRVPGYLGVHLTSYHKHSAPTIREAVDAVYAKIEEWRDSGRMKEDRSRYIKQYDFLVARYDKASVYERTRLSRVAHPGKIEPERPLPRKDTI